MRLLHTVLAVSLAATACAAPPQQSSAREASAPSPSVSLTPSPSPSLTPSPSRSLEPAPGGLLVEIRAARHDGFDRLVFEFGGDKPPTPHHHYTDAVTHDPSDKPVPLRGKAFVAINMQDAFLSTEPREPDPSQARRYTGPTRIAPELPLILEVAEAGDFEAVLSFGVGLSRPAEVRVQTLTSPARVVFDFVY